MATALGGPAVGLGLLAELGGGIVWTKAIKDRNKGDYDAHLKQMAAQVLDDWPAASPTMKATATP